MNYYVVLTVRKSDGAIQNTMHYAESDDEAMIRWVRGYTQLKLDQWRYEIYRREEGPVLKLIHQFA